MNVHANFPFASLISIGVLITLIPSDMSASVPAKDTASSHVKSVAEELMSIVEMSSLQSGAAISQKSNKTTVRQPLPSTKSFDPAAVPGYQSSTANGSKTVDSPSKLSSSSVTKQPIVQLFNPMTHIRLGVPLLVSAESSSLSLNGSPSNSSASPGTIKSRYEQSSMAKNTYGRPSFLKDQCIQINQLSDGAFSAIGCAPYTVDLPCIIKPANVELPFPKCCPEAFCPPNVKAVAV